MLQGEVPINDVIMTHILSLQVQLWSKLDELEQMMVKLNMSVMGQPGLSSTDIVSGLLCCVSSIIDKRWYRAVVISAHDGSGGGGAASPQRF